MGELNGYTEESISGHKTVKAYHQEDTMNARFQLKNTDACNAYYQADYTSSPMGPAVNFMNNLSLSLISCIWRTSVSVWRAFHLNLRRIILVCSVFQEIFRPDQ